MGNSPRADNYKVQYGSTGYAVDALVEDEASDHAVVKIGPHLIETLIRGKVAERRAAVILDHSC